MDYTERRMKELMFKLKQNMGSMSDEDIEACQTDDSWLNKMGKPSDTEK